MTRPRDEAKGAVGLVSAAAPPAVPEPVAAKPVAAEAEEPGEETPLPDATVWRQWVVSAVALAAVIVVILALHGPIGHAWPPMLRVYHALGLE